MSDLSIILPTSGLSGWAYDPVRKDLEIISSNGTITGWNVETQTVAFTLDIGGKPGAAGVSPDGRYLVVGNYDRIETSASFAVTPTYADQVTRIDLTDLSHQAIQYSIPSDELGVRDVAVTSTGQVLITGQYNGSGWTPVRTFDVSHPGVVSDVAAFNQVSDNSQMLPSDQGHYVLLQYGNSTPGQAFLYNATTGAIVGQSDPWSLGTGSQWGGGDVSEARNLVVNVSDYGVYAFDMQMHPVANLSSYGANSAIAAAAFNPDGSRIYLWQGEQSHVFVLDSLTYKQVGTLEVGSVGPMPGYATPYSMHVVDGGKLLVLDTGSSLEVVDIQAHLNTQIDPVTLTGTAGPDSLTGGAGDDVLSGGDGANTLRGGYGADTLTGGAAFDDINGNQGADLEHGGGGDDWVVGGKGDDVLFGDAGGDVVYGNLGNDTVDGGDGADQVRGGQGNDIITGGAGNDWLSGDRGNDTLTGGAGADTFHTFTEAGIDRVIDFNAAEGDHVQLDPGTVYTVSQNGADTLINLGGQGQMILVGVQLSSLPSGWIFTA